MCSMFCEGIYDHVYCLIPSPILDLEKGGSNIDNDVHVRGILIIRELGYSPFVGRGGGKIFLSALATNLLRRKCTPN